MTYIAYAWDHRDAILAAILGILVTAKFIVALTPTPADDAVIGKLYKLIEWASLTFGKAKMLPPNKDPAKQAALVAGLKSAEEKAADKSVSDLVD